MADELMNPSVEQPVEEQPETAAEANAEVEAALNAARKAAVEAIVYVTEEPVTLEQITAALGDSTREEVLQAVLALQGEYGRAERGLEIREIAGGYKMFTKPEHHETIRKFVKNLTPPLKLSMAALETLATIAYRQPITVPEIQQIRGVNAVGVLKTLLERKLVTTAGRKNVMGRPVLYKTTRDFLVKFGLSSLQDLPTLEEFGELARAALGEPPSEAEIIPDEAAPEAQQSAERQAAGSQEPSSEEIAHSPNPDTDAS